MNQVVNRTAKITGFVIVIAISALGYLWGNRSAHILPIRDRFLIAGDSMAPTLNDGETRQVLPVGSPLRISPLRIGDVVAIRWGGKRRVKRLAAAGGDTVDLVDGRLIVNGRRLEDIIADRTDDDFIAPAIVQVSSNQDHWNRSETFGDWMVYTHHNPHQADQVTPVMDDYPINSSVRRLLNPVDRLVVQLHAFDSRQTPQALPKFPVIVFAGAGFNQTVMSNGVARSRPARDDVVETIGQGREIEEHRHAAKHLDVLDSLDASHPIAIQITSELQLKYRYHVYREIEYRDDKPSGEVDYPVRLSEDEVFVVGDNVPVSVDSRQIGPLQRTAIIGRVL